MEELNILDADLPTMIVRCNNTLILRSVITGRHIEVLGSVPCWRERPEISVEVLQRNERIEREFAKAFEAVLSLIPNDMQQQKKTMAPTNVNTNPNTNATKRAPATLKIECNNNNNNNHNNNNNNNNKNNTNNNNTNNSNTNKNNNTTPDRRITLPPCKVQRNYSCSHCNFYTQNPRSHLVHQRDVHGVRLSIHTCQHCQYASRYCQKLKRHVKMVHSGESLNTAVAKVRKPSVAAAAATSTATATATATAVNCVQRGGENILKATIVPSIPKAQPPPPPPPIPPPPPLSALTMKPPEIQMEQPSSSKRLFTPPSAVNIKSDPEAFFVSAYKNQIEQFEKDHQLKNIGNLFRNNTITKSSNLSVYQVPKQPMNIVAPVLTNSQQAPIKIGDNMQLTLPEIRIDDYDKKHLYSCRKCNYMTHIKSRYNKHVKYHSMPMIQCNICEFRTTYKWNLTRHLRNHHVNGIYKCSICSFSANMKQSLSSHEVNHHSPPVGTAAHNKTIRKRRCRVGGSDLQAECSNSSPTANNIINPNVGISSLSTFGSSSITQKLTEQREQKEQREYPSHQQYENNNQVQDLSISIKTERSSENDINIPKSNSHFDMDISDIESSNLESSDCSDMETSDIDSSNSSANQNSGFVRPRLHIDADYQNDDEIKSYPNYYNNFNHQPSLTTISQSNANNSSPTPLIMQCLDLRKKSEKPERSSSASTLSADETFHFSSENVVSSSMSRTPTLENLNKTVSPKSIKSPPPSPSASASSPSSSPSSSSSSPSSSSPSSSSSSDELYICTSDDNRSNNSQELNSQKDKAGAGAGARAGELEAV